jgi:hypothetical protein
LIERKSLNLHRIHPLKSNSGTYFSLLRVRAFPAAS